MKQFHLICRAVILQNHHILLARQKGADNTFLPGGHIEIGESAKNALKRELKEELNFEIKVNRYLGAVEADWEKAEVKHYEINHIFMADIINLETTNNNLTSFENHLEFKWSLVDDLDDHNLLPHPLISLIKNLVDGDNSIWWESTL